MSTPHILMLLSNPFRPDPRVARETRALAAQGYRVTIICWDRKVELPECERQNGVDIIRVHTVQSDYGSGWRQLFYLPRFWRAATRLAVDLQPDAVHCHDLDTLFAGRQVKKQLGCPLVYDAHEHYPALMSLYLPAPFVIALEKWERWLMRAVDVTITASTVLRDELLAAHYEPVISLGNYPELSPYLTVTGPEAAQIRAELELTPDDLMVVYIGGFSRNRMLLPLIETAKLLPAVQFHLWGDGAQRADVEQAAARYPNATYHDWLGPADLPRYFKAADIIYYCLRLDYPGAIYNAPNTLAQAMAAGRPIIANDVGDLGRIVRQTRCGALIEEVTPQTIAAAVQQLQNPDTRSRLGENALQAAQSSYNAAAIQTQLIEIYHTLLG